MKKNVLVGLGLVSLLMLGACGQGDASSDESVKKVGVLQTVQHGSFDEAYEGFKEGLAENGYVEGENLEIAYQNAQNNQDNLKSMSEKLIKDQPDLLLGIGTPAGQSIANGTTDIPALVTAVTDLKAAKLVKTYEEPGTNMSGTTNLSPITKQIDLLLSVTPDAKKVGLLYNAGEVNSQIQIDVATEYLEELGLEIMVRNATSTNDVQQATESVASEVDAIYIPTDSTFASAATVVGEVVKQHKIPLVAGSVNQVKEGGLVTLGVDYVSLGKQTGEMAAKILDGEAEPQTMPVESARDLAFYVNEDMAEALGIDPASIEEPK
ncbi:ABC transporter substrate-binding protein [Enterococcus sp. 669A]|uniref:ABC transporter substrate-binding protein n=1 Tax=Candidatus Enterococcus moelleringii TaxID=2815325 RepID=A0ABS3LDP7_9ENTE|nr:ABC transporter substrate-binding protein [Enterococcus sp. 669A]MBO1307749.1 ABC transporter substrate-binding protein [Enterococcus sp. 669A]